MLDATNEKCPDHVRMRARELHGALNQSWEAIETLKADALKQGDSITKLSDGLEDAVAMLLRVHEIADKCYVDNASNLDCSAESFQVFKVFDDVKQWLMSRGCIPSDPMEDLLSGLTKEGVTDAQGKAMGVVPGDSGPEGAADSVRGADTSSPSG